ncbi:metallophosphoesterase [Sphingobacterium psychroaquaticum]|uniref:Calcineurin-like phosphoesterase n=1 Tax=Sphingobacterium psychroaquaticum TaxID=561061 RepID=A0A1X7JQW2_9SPHI|nr:metallophosphoesterase [Sphingobacterium psychroaquaticum]SMG29890.1 Calcineurin-like phosphoesterase [Sphingobacterium psychroaquaticum]
MRGLFTWILLFGTLVLSAQEKLVQRLILIGDAGEINVKQWAILEAAAQMTVANKTVAFFLGDNIYPVGMGLEGVEREATAARLQAQFTPFRSKETPVYFIAGNHDWDKSGVDGLKKIQEQERYIQELNDPGLHFVPQAGTTAIFELSLAEDLVALLYDSEYWLFPYHEDAIQARLESDRSVFRAALAERIAKNENKTLLLLSHHPMRSYGEHGLSFSWKQHIFPLTAKWPVAYVPLPLVGSLYPLLRSTAFKTAEDLKHPLYRGLTDAVTKAAGEHRNLLYVSGHDHGLQYIEDENFKQIVSGSGSKSSHIRNSKDLLYKYEKQGFCMLDYWENKNLTVTFFIYENGKVHQTFEYIIAHQ